MARTTHGDLYVSCTDEQVQWHLNVFQRIFEENEHGGHYKMMMGDAYVALATSSVDGQTSNVLPILDAEMPEGKNDQPDKAQEALQAGGTD